VAQFVISLVGLELGGGIIALAIAYMVSGIVLRLCARYFFMKELEIKEHISGKSEMINKKELAKIFDTLWYNAKKAGVSTISTTIMTQSGTLICSGFLGVNATAEYGLAFQIVSVLVGVGQIMYQIKLPVITNAKAVNDIEQQQKGFSLSVVCYFFVTIAGVTFCALFLNQILMVLKSNTVFNVLLFLGVSLYYVPENNYAIHAGYISTGNELPFVKSLAFTAIARILLLLFFVRIMNFGTLGIVLAGVISNFSYIVWKWPAVALKQLKLSPVGLVKIGIVELIGMLQSFFKRKKASV
jgi:O-antigen/teichoic acid export membrane protein